jgi:HAD superfamily hydrolase (TIGR01549 family)
MIKGVVFDVGQTLSNQPDKTGLQDRNKIYYEYIYEQLHARNFKQTFPHLDSYLKSQFVEDLNTEVVSHKLKKDESNQVITEVKLSEHTLDILIKHHNLLSSQQLTREDVLSRVPELDEVNTDKSNIKQGTYELWPDTLATLQKLKELGYKTALASNCAHAAKHEFLLETLGVLPYIDQVVISSYVGVRKPNPKMLEIICERLGLGMHEIVMVGDMLDRDVMIGNLAGAKTVWINVIPYNWEQNIKRLSENQPIYKPTAGITALSQLIDTIKYLEQPPNPDQIRVGYFLPNAKKKFEMAKTKAFTSTPEIHFMPIELHAPLEAQGPFDAIVQKATTLLVNSNPRDKDALDDLDKYLIDHPSVVCIDPISSIAKVASRKHLTELINHASEISKSNTRAAKVYDESSVVFPCVIKSDSATILSEAHKMAIVRNEAGKQAALTQYSSETTFNEFVHHSGGVVKVYCVGEHLAYTVKASCTVARLDADFLIFDSAKPWPEILHSSDTSAEVDRERLLSFSKAVQEVSGMSLFGFDMLIEENTGDYVIVDINYLPSLSAFDDLPTILNAHIVEKVKKHKSLNN